MDLKCKEEVKFFSATQKNVEPQKQGGTKLHRECISV